MPSAAFSSRIWVESLVRGTAGASLVLACGLGSVAYVRDLGAMALAEDGRKAGARNFARIDRGRADMVDVWLRGERMHLNRDVDVDDG
jgi:hypothetical protein